MLKVLEEQFRSQNGELPKDLDGLAREGARRMLAVALELEVEAYLAKHADARDERGHLSQPVRSPLVGGNHPSIGGSGAHRFLRLSRGA